MKVAQQARRSQRDDDWQHVSELLAEDVVWQFAGNGIGELWRGRRGRADVLAALQVSQNNWSRLQTEAVNAFAAGDQVLVGQESTVLAEDGAKGGQARSLRLCRRRWRGGPDQHLPE